MTDDAQSADEPAAAPEPRDGGDVELLGADRPAGRSCSSGPT